MIQNYNAPKSWELFIVPYRFNAPPGVMNFPTMLYPFSSQLKHDIVIIFGVIQNALFLVGSV